MKLFANPPILLPENAALPWPELKLKMQDRAWRILEKCSQAVDEERLWSTWPGVHVTQERGKFPRVRSTCAGQGSQIRRGGAGKGRRLLQVASTLLV
jgi:hypothetical protein